MSNVILALTIISELTKLVQATVATGKDITDADIASVFDRASQARDAWYRNAGR